MQSKSCSVFWLSLAILAWHVTSAAPQDAKENDSIEPKFLTNIRQVTTGFEKAGEGYFSPDGKSIIYQAIRREYPFYQIYVQALDGDRPKLISTGRGRTTCSNFSPDGQRLIFASSHLDPNLYETESETIKQEEADRKAGVHRRYSWPFDPAMDIFETDLNGKILKRLTSEQGYDAEGAFSKDGEKIAFCSTRDGDPDIYLMNADGTDVKQITDAPGYDGGPFISPNGKWITYRSDRKQPELLQIYVIGIDGENDTAVTDDEHGVNWGPYWHPTKPYIIWSGADHSDPNARPNYDLWLVRYTEDGEIKSVKEDLVVINFGADDGVSTGDRFDVFRGKKYVGEVEVTNLHRGNRATGRVTRKLEDFQVKDSVVRRKSGEANETKPARKLGFGERIRVTDFPGADVLPVFSPDGTKLMWTSTRTDDHTSQLFIADFHLPE